MVFEVCISPDDRLEPRGTLPARLKVRMYVCMYVCIVTIILQCITHSWTAEPVGQVRFWLDHFSVVRSKQTAAVQHKQAVAMVSSGCWQA